MNNLENVKGRIYTGAEILESRMAEIIPMYQKAFAGDPWFEVSKCASDKDFTCDGGYSSLRIGQTCMQCVNVVTEPAYPKEEIIDKLTHLSNTRKMYWYVEEIENGEMAMASYVTISDALTLTREKYSKNSAMQDWIEKFHGSNQFGWLDEVFANKEVRSTGNLKNFGAMITALAKTLDVNTISYRTINPRMLVAAIRDLGEQVTIYEPHTQVPDHRYYISINTEENR